VRCRDTIKTHRELLHELQLQPSEIGDAPLYRAVGCDDCHHTGYRGRTGVYEVFRMSPKLRKMILDRASSAELKACAIEEGMLTLRRDGLRKMVLGDTTPDEVLRETAAD
jgi:type II secretory ATPase GspE/PulE/Tfp pilus assembly ATPase PilB-like protein